MLKGEDYSKIKERVSALQKALEEIGASIYKGGTTSAGPEAGNSQGPDEGAGPTDGNATDADFKVEK